MIKPNELRLGNLLNWIATHENAGVSKVIDIDRGSFVVMTPHAWTRSDDHNNKIEPISITSEWLKQCGFERDEHGRWTGHKYETDQFIQWFEIEEDKKAGLYWLRGSEWVMGRPFQYLHQLQNLYFALTGEELAIKETV
jgi:hypothetical protein